MADRRAELIRARYEHDGWSLHGFARHCGLSTVALNNIEAGDIDKSRRQTLVKLFHGLGWHIDRIDDFLAGTEPDATWETASPEVELTPALEERIREIVRDELDRRRR